MPIRRLISGGMIVNYQCQAACRHCMYGCSPRAEPGYMTEETASRICENLLRLGCTGLHVGGGEPFLNPEGLVKVIKVIKSYKISLSHIETNAAWISGNAKRDQEKLIRVKQEGGDFIMISVDPFHVEFIPIWKIDNLVAILRNMGIYYQIWQQRYMPMLKSLDSKKTYTGEELRKALGYDVVTSCIREYGVGFNGRALNLVRHATAKKPPVEFLSSTSCEGLYGATQFHVDFLGRLSHGCPGMGILIEDADKELDPKQYPVISKLLSSGVTGLWEYALSMGFQPDPEGYASKCDLCFCMRKFLFLLNAKAHPDLSPASFYQQDY